MCADVWPRFELEPGVQRCELSVSVRRVQRSGFSRVRSERARFLSAADMRVVSWRTCTSGVTNGHDDRLVISGSLFEVSLAAFAV